MRNLIDMTIDIEPLRYGSFDVRIVEIGKHYECDLYIDNGEVECLMDTDIPTRDDREDKEMQRRIIAAALEEYPGQIEGFNRFVNIECDGDYKYAIKTLLNRNGLVASGSLYNYNKRVKTNIEASPKDMFVHESLNKSMNESLLGNFNIKNKTNRNIKIAFVPINSIKGYVEDVSDNKFLNLAATYGKVYSADDFNYIWNNYMFNFRPNNYYARIIY